MAEQADRTGVPGDLDEQLPAARPSRLVSRAVLAGFLIVLAVLFAVLYRRENERENHSYNDGAKPPAGVQLTVGRTYEISTPGGMGALLARGGSPSELNCNYTADVGTETRQLDVVAMATDTRTTHAVATFVAPASGFVRIECRGLSATYVDDADNVSGDPAGLFLLLCTISLTAGAVLALSVLYRRGQNRPRGGQRRRHPDNGDDGGSEPEVYSPLLARPTDT